MSEREQGACTTPHTRCCHHQSSSTLSGRCVHGSWIEIALIRLVSSVLYFLGVNTNTSHTRACVSLSKSSSFMYKSESRALFSLSHTHSFSPSVSFSLSLSLDLSILVETRLHDTQWINLIHIQARSILILPILKNDKIVVWIQLTLQIESQLLQQLLKWFKSNEP